jgi:NAD(P)-dependent dehydrogenase (short-subunit alcohol dehydrogenase family)
MNSAPKRILVTGGAKRVGRRLVERLSAVGHSVVIHANANAAEAEALCKTLRSSNPRTWTIRADLADHAAACALVGQASQLIGAPLSGLINSASVFEYDRPSGVDVAIFDRAMAINLRAPTLLSEAFAAQADAALDNCIVHLLDQKLWNMNPDFYSYTMSKAGLLAATDMMARAFAPAVRVNAIAPGLLLPSFDQTPEEFARLAAANPLRRPIGLEEVASAAEYLLSATSLTGQTLHVDNGQRLAGARRDAIFAIRDPEAKQ